MQVTNGGRVRYPLGATANKEIVMKKLIAALALTVVVATPAMAGAFRQSGASNPSPGFAYNETAKGKAYRAPTSKENGPIAAHNGTAALQMAQQSHAQANRR
jgi:hypothetical protein